MSASDGMIEFEEPKPKDKINWYQKTWIFVYLVMFSFFVVYTFFIIKSKSTLLTITIMTIIFFLYVWSDNLSLRLMKLNSNMLRFSRRTILLSQKLLEKLGQTKYNTLEQDLTYVFEKRKINVNKITVLKGARKYIIEVKRNG